MATIEAATESEPELVVEPEFPPHRMTIDRYERLVEAGVYGADDPVFLWKGKLVEKMTKGDPHAFSSSSLTIILIRMVPDRWNVRGEQPIVLSGNSVPEPDLTIVRGSPRDYLARTPRADDVTMVIEVSDSSVSLDSVTKLRAYAADGIPVYWLVNLPKSRIEVYTRPTGPAENPTYQERRDFGPDDEVPVVLDGREVGRVVARDILP